MIMISDRCEILPYSASHEDSLKEMLRICFNQDYKIPLTEQQLEALCKEICRQAAEKIVFLDLLFLNGRAEGFINYQVDTPQSDWCEKETWGFIRELYISPALRKKGYGQKLAEHAESKLWALSVPNIYLTTDDAIEFWLKLGYHDTAEICPQNNGSILTK